MNTPEKEIIVIGGPNGAGKTTAAKLLLPKQTAIAEFVNADEIARGISPNDVETAALAAGRAMLERLEDLVSRNTSFALETTCAGRGHVRLLQRAQAAGWQVSLLFFWLPSAAVAAKRVARRVGQGGHNIPPDVIERRYRKGIINMRDYYLPLSDVARIYDNSDTGRKLIAEKSKEYGLVVLNEAVWSAIEGMS